MLNGLLKDGINDTTSSKRFITLLAFLMCAIAFISNLFWGLKVDETLYQNMIYLTIAGLGLTASEKFAPVVKQTKSVLQ